MEPELETGLRRKTPERRLVWRRMQLLLGCLMATPSADLLVDELPVDEADLIKEGESSIKTYHEEVPPSKTLHPYQLICAFTCDFDILIRRKWERWKFPDWDELFLNLKLREGWGKRRDKWFNKGEKRKKLSDVKENRMTNYNWCNCKGYSKVKKI